MLTFFFSFFLLLPFVLFVCLSSIIGRSKGSSWQNDFLSCMSIYGTISTQCIEAMYLINWWFRWFRDALYLWLLLTIIVCSNEFIIKCELIWTQAWQLLFIMFLFETSSAIQELKSFTTWFPKFLHTIRSLAKSHISRFIQLGNHKHYLNLTLLLSYYLNMIGIGIIITGLHWIHAREEAPKTILNDIQGCGYVFLMSICFSVGI